MANKKVTRRALFTSIMSLILCCAMLMGTTFAWFTDSVTSSNNIIKSGTLDVEMYYNEDNSDTWEDASKGAIFNGNHWEPGFTQVRYIKIANTGSLAFKFQLNIIGDTAAGAVNLADVIDVYMIENPSTVLDRNLTGATRVGTLSELMADNDGAAYGVMLPEEGKRSSNVASGVQGIDGYAVYGIALKMQENAGNEYQNLSVGNTFTVQLMATQYTYENDAFGSDYDGASAYSVAATGTSVVSETGNTKVEAIDKNTQEVVATADVPAAALDENVSSVTLKVIETAVPEQVNVKIQSNEAATSFDVSVSGIKAENSEKITVVLKLRAGLSGVTLYHNEVAMNEADYKYIATTGELTFQTDSFSPFTVVYKNEDVVVNNTPVAKVTNTGAKTVSATEGMGGMVSKYDLDTSFCFETTESYESAQQSPYAKWHADFVVSANKNVAAESIALVGYYAAYCDEYNDDCWVALKSDADIEAGAKIRLLDVLFGGDGTGMSNGYINYEELCNWIPKFDCGVADLGNNDETTINVELRLYEVEEPSEENGNSWNKETGKFITVATYNYTFK